MSAEQGLLLAIRDEPEDDLPRHAYADWLEEQGGEENEARAEFIRVQIALARLPEDDAAQPALLLRERQLQNAWQKRWLTLLEPLGASVTGFVRGFPERLIMTAADFLRHGEQLLTLGPISNLELTDVVGLMPEFAECPLLRNVSGLTIRGHRNQVSEELRHLLTSPHLKRLRFLDLSGQRLGRVGLDVLIRAELPGLRELILGYNELSNDGLTALLSASWLLRLERLDLCSNGLGTVAVESLVDSPHLRDLRHLDLGYNSISTAGAETLARSALLSRLRVLRLGRNGIELDGIAALAHSPLVANLWHLDLGCNYVGRQGTLLLVGSPHLAGLHFLDLRFDIHDVGDSGCAYIAESPYLRRLTRLDLSSNAIREAGVAALADSSNLKRLRLLDLYHNRISTTGALAIARSPYLGCLTQLNLNGAQIEPEGMVALARSPNLTHVLEMDLRGNRAGTAGLEALASSPHLSEAVELWLDSQDDNGAAIARRFGDRVKFW